MPASDDRGRKVASKKTKRRDNRHKEIDHLVGWRVRELRLIQGLSQKDVAQRIGLSHQQFQKYENGTSSLSLVWAVRVARELGVPLQTLLDGALEPTEAPQGLNGQHYRHALRAADRLLAIPDPAVREEIERLIHLAAKAPE